MANASKKQKKQFVGEEDMSTLLQRYKPTTVLALLKEVSEVENVKIDWNAMVKKTSTGISSAREYQMLWRHLAYHDILLDRFDDVSQPLDDDSDLECELEAVPAVSTEASAETTAYVKVLMASGASNDPNSSKVEGPLILNIPKGQMLKAPVESNPDSYLQGTHVAVPVWVQKQSVPSTTNSDILKRKAKRWSAVEDEELIAAVQKHGEGNWASILKGEFKSDRTALQLSQRWANIRKRQGNLNVGNSSQLSEAQLAARHAVSMALDNRPKLNAVRVDLGQRAGIETSRLASQTPSMPPSQHDAVSRLVTEKASTKPDSSPDSMVKAAAVAAGARIATPSDGASLLNTAAFNSAAHIMPGGSSLKPPIAGNENSLPSNVHFIRTGLATKPLSYPTVAGNSSQTGRTQVPGSSRKKSFPLPQPNSAIIPSEFGASSHRNRESQSNPVSCIVVKEMDGSATFSSSSNRKLITPEDQSGHPCNTTGNVMADEQCTSPDATRMDLDAGNCSKDHFQGSQTSV